MCRLSATLGSSMIAKIPSSRQPFNRTSRPLGRDRNPSLFVPVCGPRYALRVQVGQHVGHLGRRSLCLTTNILKTNSQRHIKQGLCFWVLVGGPDLGYLYKFEAFSFFSPKKTPIIQHDPLPGVPPSSCPLTSLVWDIG